MPLAEVLPFGAVAEEKEHRVSIGRYTPSATEATTYRIGSTSKQFTAVLLLKMVDRGTLSLEDSIGHFLTGLRPEWRPLTIELGKTVWDFAL